MPDARLPGNPFPGLRPFDVADHNWFFGRDDHIRDVLGHLRRTRFLAVLGSSGCGKSSLIRAGVLPPLKNGFMATTRTGWRIAVMRPGDQPIRQLAVALSSTEDQDDPGDDALKEINVLDATLRRTSFGILDVAKSAGFGSEQKLLILVDQFEELFRFVEERDTSTITDETRAFVKLLIEASRQREVPIYVIITMRSEFLGHCTPFPNLPEAINRGLFLVPRLGRDPLRDVVEQPVLQAHGEISNRLVNRLLNDCGDDPDQLPLLQHALMRLWSRYEARGRSPQIDLDDYDAVGGLSGALSQHVNEIYQGLSERDQRLAETLFRNLTDVTSDGHMVRRPNALKAICVAAGATAREINGVVNEFRGQGKSFLMPPIEEKDPLEDKTKLDISHESLIRQWGKLEAWTLSEATHRRVGKMVAAEAARWDQSGRDEGLLLGGVRLAEAIEWARRPSLSVVLKSGGRSREVDLGWLNTDHTAVDEVDALQRQFVAASERKNRQAVRTRFATFTVVVALMIVCLLAVGVAVQSLRAGNALTKARDEEKSKQQQERFQKAKTEIENLVWQAQGLASEKPLDSARLAIDAVASAEKLRDDAESEAAVTVDVPLAFDYLRQTLSRLHSSGMPNQLLLHPGAGEVIPVSALALSSDGLWLLTARGTNSAASHDLGVWRRSHDPAGFRHLQGLDFCDQRVRAVAFSSDGKWLAAGSDDRGVRVWQFDGSNEPPVQNEAGVELPGIASQVWTLDFSADNQWLATGSDDGQVHVWEVASLEGDVPAPVARLEKHSAPVRGLRFGSDNRLVTGCDDAEARLWDLSNPDQPVLVKRVQHDGPVRVIEFDASNRWLLTAGFGNAAQLWDLTADTHVALSGHRGRISSAAFSAEGPWLITGSFDRTARVWQLPDELDGEITTGIVLGDHDGHVWSVAFGRDWLVTGSADRTARLWQIASVTDTQRGVVSIPLRLHDDEVRTVATTPQDDLLVTASEDGTARAWFLDQDQTLRGGSDLYAAVADGQGSRLVTCDRNAPFVRMWDVHGTPPRGREFPHDEAVLSAAFDGAGERLLTGGMDGVGRLWSTSSAGPPLELKGHSDRILAVALQPQGPLAATGSRDKTVRIWTRDADQPAKVVEHAHYVRAVAFSTDGRWLAAAGDDGLPKLIDLDDLDREALDLEAHKNAVRVVAFSPDSRWLATGGDDGFVHLWDVSSGDPPAAKATRRLELGDNITQILFFDRYLAVGSDDGTLRWWQRDTLAAAPQDAHEMKMKSSVTAMASGNVDGICLAVGGQDGSVRLWRYDAGKATDVDLQAATGTAVTALAFVGRRLCVTQRNGESRFLAVQQISIRRAKDEIRRIVGRRFAGE